jgi:hypothetical protein
MPGLVAQAAELIRPGLPPVEVHADELPPMITVVPYAKNRASEDSNK